MTLHLRSLRILGIGLVVLLSLMTIPRPAAAEDEKTWSTIRADIIGDAIPEDGTAFLSLVAPPRAEDAAIVPIEIRIRLPDGDTRKVTSVTLVVDENPAPIVGVFRLGEGRLGESRLGESRGPFDIATRVRVDSYSFVRVIAQTDDGRLYMTKSYVKAAGGCSAPALKDPSESQARLGEMRFRVFSDRGDAQIQVRHPNYSGLQMNQLTRLYTPAWFIEHLDVRQGEKLLFSLEGGISISEDPTIRFSYGSTGEPVTVEAKDNEGRVFRQTFPAAGS